MVKPTNNTLPQEILPWLDLLNDQHDEMLAKTIELAEINSGSLNRNGVNEVLEKLLKLTSDLSENYERISVCPLMLINDNGDTISCQLGDALRICKRPKAPLQVFLCGHMDTVFPEDSPFQKIRWMDDDTINGPGVTDLKGGILVMLKALEVLEQSPWADQIGWEILFNPDEEIGSPGSAPLIQKAAQRVHLGMIFEPCFPDGNLAGQRKGSGNFTIVSHGKSAHAGREHHLGRNAIRALCDFVSTMDDLNGQRPGLTFNPGYIHGGGPTNIVPDRCIHKFNIRLKQLDDEQWCLQKLGDIIEGINKRDNIQLELYGEFTRKPKVLTPANKRLLSMTKNIGHELGIPLNIIPTGGCCDGNNLASAGIPNIDTLGVQGGAIHSDQEYLNIKSLVPRARLSAALLLTLAFNSANGDRLDWLTGNENKASSIR